MTVARKLALVHEFALASDTEMASSMGSRDGLGMCTSSYAFEELEASWAALDGDALGWDHADRRRLDD